MGVRFFVDRENRLNFVMDERDASVTAEEANAIAMIKLADSNDRIGFQLYRLQELLGANLQINAEPSVAAYFSFLEK